MFKFKYRTSIWWSIFRQEIFAPFTDRTALIQFMAFPFSIYFILSDRGILAMIEEVRDTLSFVWAFIWAIPFYIIFCAIRSVFCVSKKEKELGDWVGDRFVYHTPKHVKTFVINPGEDRENLRIRLLNVPPKAFVRFKSEYEDGHGYLLMKLHEKQEWGNLGTPNRDVKISVRISGKSETVVEKRIPDNSVPTIAKLSMVYWEK